MGQFRLLAGVVLVVLVIVAGSARADIYATAEGRIVEFKDIEYGFNYDSRWSIWRKPITAAQAELIKQAAAAYLEVPKDFQKVNRTKDPAHSLAGAGAMQPHVSSKHSGVKLYSYRLQMRSTARSDRGKMYVIHDVFLIVSPASKSPRKLAQHQWIELLTEPRVEIEPDRKPSQTWDVYLVITKHGGLAGPGWGKPDREEWHQWWLAGGLNLNYQDGWSVRLKYD